MGEAVEKLEAHLFEHGMPTDPQYVTREHLRWTPSSWSGCRSPTQCAPNRYRSVYRFFKYLGDIGELREHPMTRMKPPQPEEMLIPVVSSDHLRPS